MQQVLHVAKGDAAEIFCEEIALFSRTIDVAYAVYKFLLNGALVQ